MKRLVPMLAVTAISATLFSAPDARATQDAPPPLAAQDLSGLHAFDFLIGRWNVHHRKLTERLAGSHDWIEFDGTCQMRPLMDGWSNVDDNMLQVAGAEYRGVGLRAYDAKTGEWSIWWLDSRMPAGPLDPPVKGRFVDGVGTFYSDDVLRGKKIRVRYVWSDITAKSAHWAQAFSPDGGKTWETNWTMVFTRAE